MEGAVASSMVEALFRIGNEKLNQDMAATPEPYYQEHFKRSKEAIVCAIEGLRGSALIFGAGCCHDLPLEAFASFDEVVLVDMDLVQTEKAVERLSPEIKSKFRLERRDLTGYFGRFEAEVERIKGEVDTFDGFVSEVVKLFSSLTSSEFAYPESRPSFICSSLVSSQLGVKIYSFLNQVSKERFGKSFPSPAALPELKALILQIQLNHIEEMKRLSGSEGKVYFADHFSMQIVTRITSILETINIVHSGCEFPGVSRIREFIGECFTTLNQSEWRWALPVGRSEGTIVVQAEGEVDRVLPSSIVELRSYNITAMVLKTRL